jgi:predicted RNase H-like HicB family nuclease
MKLDLTVQIWREGKQYVAHALPLDVMSRGPTAQAAREAIDEALRCFIKTAEDAGTLTQILEECGYSRQGADWAAPDWVGVERHAVAV